MTKNQQAKEKKKKKGMMFAKKLGCQWDERDKVFTDTFPMSENPKLINWI
jgi:hypothetical protein